MKSYKIVIIWVLGILMSASAMIYQRLTGPTHPYRQKVELNGKSYQLKLIRSHGELSDAPIEMPITDGQVKATISYRRYPTNDAYVIDTFRVEDDKMVAMLPQQPSAGKIEYSVQLTDGTKTIDIPRQVIRYKDPVPLYFLLPHISAMVLAMLFSNITLLMGLFKHGNMVKMVKLTCIFLGIGGLILGPIVQKYAFGDFWTGIPFGWDLTDNKTLIAVVFWALAFYFNCKTPSRGWAIAASVVMLAIYMIPHSMFGSQLDHDSGKVIQGFVFLPFIPLMMRGKQ